mgnify:CR=1 FL=1
MIGSDGAAEPRRVLIGLRTRTMAEVIFGLEPGETVATGDVAMPGAGERGGRRGGGARFMRG